MANTNAEALKNLWAAIKNNGSTAADLAADNTAAIIDAITAAYIAANTELGALTVNSVAGSQNGYTSITVTGNGSGALKYKVNYNTLPDYGEDLTSWTSWNGTDEIQAEDGNFIVVCEVDANSCAVAGGDTMCNVNTD